MGPFTVCDISASALGELWPERSAKRPPGDGLGSVRSGAERQPFPSLLSSGKLLRLACASVSTTGNGVITRHKA